MHRFTIHSCGLIICLLALCLFTPIHAQNSTFYHDAFFSLNYGQLLSQSVKECNDAADRLSADASLFRLYNSALYMEDADTVHSALIRAAEKNPVISQSPFYTTLLIRSYSRTSADIAGHSLHRENLLENHTISGPFPYDSLQSFTDLSVSDPSSWRRWSIQPDPDGTIDFSRYFTTTAQKCYIVQAQCTIARSGEYILTLGKTGYTEIYVNGRRLGLNTDTHGFFPVQYLSRIVLSRGTHTITVKTAPGDASHRLSLALLPDSSVYSTVPGDTVSRIDALYDPQTDEEVFNTAFLMNAAGLDGYDMAYRYFSSIPETSPYYYPSLYYRHRDSTSSSDKIDLLQRMHAIKPSPRVSHELSMLYASFGSFYQAFSHASKVEQHNRLASALLYTSLYSKTGWTDLALTETSRISSALPDTSSAHSARLYRSLDNHARAFRLYESLVDRYPRNAELLFIYCDYLEKQSSHDRLEELLYRSIHLFPELVNLRLRLGRSLYEQGKPDEAITVLSSVSRKMPYHPELLYLFSRCYMKKGNRNLAELYADRAGTLDPENRTISFYIDNTFSSKPRLASYTREFDIDALAAESDRYADEPAVMLYSETIEKLQTDGSSLKRVRKAFKIHDSDNCRGLSNLQIVLNAQTESILSLDFSVRAGDRRYISQQTRRQSLSDPESRLYYDIELVTAQLPLFEDDCIITSDYTISSSEGVEYKGYFGSRTYFPTDYRILEAYDTVITPRDTRLSWGLQHIDPAAHSVSLSAGERRYVTHIHSQAPVIREENAVPYFNRVPAVTYSTFSTWDEFHSWYSSLLSDRVIVTAPMKKAVRTLLAGSEKPEEKISALYSFITDRTRYVGFEIGIGGIQPRSTKETYQTGLGDCKDIALLLAALLREAGFNAELALVRTYNKGWADRQIPYVGNFNHAICFVDHDDGLFLDGTVNKASIHDLPLSDRNAEALIIRKDGYAFRTIEPEAYTPGTDEVSNDVTLKEDGSATLVRRLVKRGPIAVYFRNDYTTDDKKIRYLARYWNSVYPGSVISDYTVSGLESTGAVSYSYTIDIPSFFDPADDTVTIPGFIMPVRYTAQIAPQSTRHGPLFMDSAHETRLSTTVHIPEGFSVYALPDDVTLTAPFFTAQSAVQQTSDGYTIDYTQTISSGIIEPGEYPEFRNTLIHHDTKHSQKIVLKKNEK